MKQPKLVTDKTNDKIMMDKINWCIMRYASTDFKVLHLAVDPLA